MVAKIKGLSLYNSNAWRKNLSNWRNQNHCKRLKRVVKGRHWTYAERKKIWKHYKLNNYTPCKIKFRLYLPHTNTII